MIRGPRRAGPLAEQLLARKGEVIGAPAVEPVTPADLPADCHSLRDGRAAVMEYGGGLPRERAEALAPADVLQRLRRAGQRPHNDT